jgi:signal transduction histidine kinase
MVKLTPQTPTAVGAFSVTNLARQTLAGIMASNEQASTFLVDGDGQVLFQTGNLRITEPPSDHPGVREALRGESGTSYLSMNESEHVIAFNPVIPTGWALVIEEPWDAVASPLLRYTGSGPLVLVPVLIFTLAALWFGARRIIQPLKELETRSAALAWGDYQAVEYPVGGIAEIGNLQQTLIHLAHKVQSAQQGLRDYIGAITTGQEEERLRLARELHDDTLQSLIALNQKVQIAARSPQNKDTIDSLTEIQNLIEQTIQDLRRLTRALRPLYLEDLGLVAALDMLARETSQTNDFPIHFSSQGVEQRLPGPEEIAIYRMAQEGLSNITRHAQASQANLNLTFESGNVVLLITDDGKGFEVPESPAEFAPHGHFGLLGIQERAELIGARLEIYSSPDEGTKLKVSIPIRQKDKSKSD